MEDTIHAILTDPSARKPTDIETRLASELSAGAPWYDEAAK